MSQLSSFECDKVSYHFVPHYYNYFNIFETAPPPAFRPEMVPVEGGVIFYQPLDANGVSRIEFFNLTDNTFYPIGKLLFGRAVAVALPVHGINCRNDNHDNE